MTEGQRLQRIGRTAKDPVKLRRAIVVLMSVQGQSAPDIAHLLDCSVEYVRGVIHATRGSPVDRATAAVASGSVSHPLAMASWASVAE
jgi:transposase